MTLPQPRSALPMLLTLLACGCAGFSPIHGRHVRNVDPALLVPAKPRTPARTIDPGLLGQPKPTAHVVDTGDILGIYIEGVMGTDEQGPPLTAPIQLNADGLTTVVRPAPEIGYPITVSQGGTITLPQKPPIDVRGLTLAEVRAELRDIYVGGEGATLREGREKIVVTLQKPRTVRVLVVRKDRSVDPGYAQPPDYRRVEDGRGSGVLVELPIYENDVIHAIVASGGMPGQDGENAVRVIRSGGAWAGLGPVPNSHSPGWSTSGWSKSAAGPSAADRQDASPRSLFGHSVASKPGGGAILQASHVGDHLGHSYGGQSAMTGVGHTAGPVAGPPRVGPQPAVVVRSDRFNAVTPAPDRPTFVRARETYAGRSALFGNAACGCGRDDCDGPDSPACMWDGRAVGVRPGDPFRSDPFVTGLPAAFCDATIDNPNVRYIPLTLLPGECVPFDRCDVLLQDGDIVFVESRSKDFFYTAGLLGGGKYPLPRDEDLDLLDAIALVDSQRRVLPTKAVGGVSSLNQDVTVGASRVVIYRESPTGEVVPIRMNLNELKRDPSKSILILPGDRIFLQYTRMEAVAASFERHFLDGTVLGVASGITFSD